ncbi:LOW QUALITY PROTEIN: putative F-box protein PP2-B12 [Punica granatum]|uniref:LOW QUALITY PROTEIN: putative F-box protein PP2-B12 n=1 Tax=Punica granatum TaxID=22663 RepID=A0A6P8C6E9_PUNGR|nr:LOW QUALITY PROTEIN: putative F-box protein PP2-B12 [Punica granatum]
MEMALGSMGMMRLDLFDISGLPEGFRSTVIALISPRDACRVSAVSSVFKSAADSDSVWERFLPTDIDSVLSRASAAPYSQTLQLSPRKQLYLSLCHRPVLIDDGRWSFSLGRSSGKKCYMLSARELSIVWGDTPRYWRWTSVPDSRFPEVAELINVCWFEIWARFDVRILSLSTLYAAYLVFKFNPDSDGFENLPIEVGVHHVDGETIMNRTVYLDHDLELLQEGTDIYPKEREDGWLEIKLGEFPCNDGYDGEMRVNLMQVDYGCWKNGLIIEGIEIRPKETD